MDPQQLQAILALLSQAGTNAPGGQSIGQPVGQGGFDPSLLASILQQMQLTASRPGLHAPWTQQGGMSGNQIGPNAGVFGMGQVGGGYDPNIGMNQFQNALSFPSYTPGGHNFGARGVGFGFGGGGSGGGIGAGGGGNFGGGGSFGGAADYRGAPGYHGGSYGTPGPGFAPGWGNGMSVYVDTGRPAPPGHGGEYDPNGWAPNWSSTGNYWARTQTMPTASGVAAPTGTGQYSAAQKAALGIGNTPPAAVPAPPAMSATDRAAYALSHPNWRG